MASPNTFRLSLVGQDGFQSTVVVTFHYVPTSFNFAPDALTLAQLFEVAAEMAVPDISVQGVNYSKVVVRDEGDPLVGIEHTVNITGTVSGDAMPPQIAGQVEKLTGLIGRRNRGRNYWPGPAEGVNANGAPSQTYRDSLIINMENLKVLSSDEIIPVELYKMVVYSKVGDVFHDVLNFRASEEWGTQGRRKPGRGA